MVMHRRKHGVNLDKLKRKDYFARTLIKAISDRLLENIRKKKPTYIQTAVSREPEKDPPTVIVPTRRTIFDTHTPSEKQTIRKNLSVILGVEIKRIICYPKDPDPVFEMELSDLPGRTIYLGSYQKGIMNQDNFRATIASLGQPVPNKVPGNVWDPTILNDLRILTEEGEIPDTATYDGQVKIYLREYFKSKQIEPKKDDDSYPFIDPQTDRIVFKLDHFRRWMSATKGTIIHFNLENAMLQAGFYTKNYEYFSPPGFYLPDTYTPKKEEEE
jgi:hypothetical protein